jgi:SAM-dependent methyltransferase
VSEEFGKAFWEDRYRGHTAVRHRQPNPQLVEEAGDLAPGTALDAGCGEGADAIWLASRGCQVTAVDIATNALRRAQEHATSEPQATTSHAPAPGSHITAEDVAAGLDPDRLIQTFQWPWPQLNEPIKAGEVGRAVFRPRRTNMCPRRGDGARARVRRASVQADPA